MLLVFGAVYYVFISIHSRKLLLSNSAEMKLKIASHEGKYNGLDIDNMVLKV